MEIIFRVGKREQGFTQYAAALACESRNIQTERTSWRCNLL